MHEFKSDPNILGGELAFEGTRLSVAKIGAMLNKGLAAEIREDYPYLTQEDWDRAVQHDSAILVTVAACREGSWGSQERPFTIEDMTDLMVFNCAYGATFGIDDENSSVFSPCYSEPN